MFYPEEGEFGFSSGMFINEGYGHFVFPRQDITYAEPIAVHELTHACLAHLPIPLWLNEGIAVNMEETLAGNALYIDHRIMSKHRLYWDQETIQKFWSGESFFAADEGQELSYNLAHVLVQKLAKDYSAFTQFTNAASFQDSGLGANRDSYEGSLGKLVESFIGDGQWEPQPHEQTES